MAIWESFKASPDENNQPPPAGAPEGGVNINRISDLFRRVMAAVFEVGKAGVDLRATLKDLAFQPKSAVDFTGGTIASGVSIDAVAIKTGTISAARLPAITGAGLTTAATNSLYELMYPWWSPRLFYGTLTQLAAYNTQLADAGITARWSVADGAGGRPDWRGRYLWSEDNNALVGGVFGSWNGTTAESGAHDHGSVTQDHALTEAQLPAHNHANGAFDQVLMKDGTGTTGATDSTPTEPKITQSATMADTGGDEPHNHGIDVGGEHTHTFSIAPPAARMWVIIRSA